MNATFIKTAELHTGTYAPTAIDASKAAADFRIIDMTGRTVTIRWRDGSRQEVTKRELAKLEKIHTWACDF